MSHQCPAPGCTATVPDHMLACRSHWFSLPKDIRDRIWQEYRAGQGSPEHLAAIQEAVNYLHKDTP